MDVFEMLGLLALVLAIAIPVSILWLIFKVARLRDRINTLERCIQDVVVNQATRSSAQAVAPAQAEPETLTAKEVSPQEAPLVEQPSPWVMTDHVAAIPLPPSAVPQQDGPIVITAERASALGDWIKLNWVYVVAAVSLAFAGVFFVQYGIEKGLLPPAARVMSALLFGGALVVAGEWVRRRSGDEPDASTAFIPSTLSGAGLVSMFAAVLAARQMYGLIGVETGFAGLLAVAALAVVLGWFYGPFLAAVGLIGAAAVPFVVGGSADAAYWLYGYFALITAAGLAIDALRRWAWVSVLALALGYAGGWIVLQGTGGEGWFMQLLVGLAVLSVIVPPLRIAPDHAGPMLTETLVRRQGGWPIFPTRIAVASVGLSTLGLTLIIGAGAAESWIAFASLAILSAVLMIWSRGARALSDLAFVPAAGLIARTALEGLNQWPLATDFSMQAIILRAAETSAPATASGLLGLGVALSLLAAWRSQNAEYGAYWAAGATLIAPLIALALELLWHPATVMGAYPWALHVIAVAGLMAFLALRFAAADREDHRRFAYATLSCLSLVALALFLIATKAALTLALSVLLVVAAGLDRRFRLPEMGLFIRAATILLSYRLIVDPGLFWAVDQAKLWEVLAAYAGAAAATMLAWRLLGGLQRPGPKVFLESAGASFAALLLNVLITRWLTGGDSDKWVTAHWAIALNAMPWMIVALVQLYRLQLKDGFHWPRRVIALVAGLLSLAGLLSAAGPGNPLFGLAFDDQTALVYGPLMFDTLLVAYGVPALLLFAATTQLGQLNRWLRYGLSAFAAALAALYVVLEIRRFWQGDDLSVPGVSQPELYSYTIAMMALGAGLLYQAIARRSPSLRRAAMAVIALTVAKVFLIDVSGLSGLTRVASFLALGLSLLGLAWLNRWAAGQVSRDHKPR